MEKITMKKSKSIASALTKITFFILLSLGLASSAFAKKILVLSNDHSAKSRVNLIIKYNKNKNLVFDHLEIDPKKINKTSFQEITKGYDLVILSSVSTTQAIKNTKPFLPFVQGYEIPLLALPWSADNPFNNKISDQQGQTINDYFRNGGAVNMDRLGNYLNHDLFSMNTVAALPPILYPKEGVYHPKAKQKIFNNLLSYLQWKGLKDIPSDRPVIGILMRLSHFGAGNNTVVDQLIVELEQQGALVIPFYVREYKINFKPMIMLGGKVIVDNIINLRTMHSPNKRAKEFTKLGVPVLHAIQYYEGTAAQWRESPQGVSPMMTPFMLAMPESAGVIDITTIAASPRKTKKVEILDEQLKAIASRAMGQANLAHKANSAKKITMMVWNYPGGEKDISATFLNVPQSIHEITTALAKEGYQVTISEEEKLLADVTNVLRPFHRDYDLDNLLKNDLAELMPVDFYTQQFYQLPKEVTAAIEKDWGKPEKSHMVVERKNKLYFVIPRIKLGNLIIMRQPTRGNNKDKEKSLYHDKTVTVNHYYLAAYLYARQQFASDAIIHLGTHGSQEYLPGKERSPSVYDATMLTVGNTPIIYPFIIDDVGEAVQAKRRGRATIISHMTPPFAAAGLYAESMDLHELMHQYNSMVEGVARKITLEKIADICIQKAYCKDIDWNTNKITAQPKAFLAALHDYLGELATESQPLGLHTLGKAPKEAFIITSLIQMLGTDFSDMALDYEANHFDNLEAVTHKKAHNPENTNHNPIRNKSQVKLADHQHGEGKGQHRHSTDDNNNHRHTINDNDGPDRGEAIESIVGYKMLEKFILNKADINTLTDKQKPLIEQAQTYYKNFHQLAEIRNLLKALSGKYIKATTGGDPVRNPEVVPTGFNLYGFDPSKVPTKAAWEAGSKLTEDLITQHYQQHGKYPEKMAFSMWSIETMRHFGVLEAQVLRAMGVRPIWTEDGRIKETEIIPYSELKRPRVDVVVSATGLYRDAFPNILEWMAEAIDKVAKLKEDNNALYRHAQATQQSLEKEGFDPEEAAYLSTVRIFSNKSGSYGTGLGSAVMESDTWEQDSKLANTYIDNMGYFYGVKRKGQDRGSWGEKSDKTDLYRKTLSGTDMAVFSRTSNLFGLIINNDLSY